MSIILNVTHRNVFWCEGIFSWYSDKTVFFLLYLYIFFCNTVRKKFLSLEEKMFCHISRHFFYFFCIKNHFCGNKYSNLRMPNYVMFTLCEFAALRSSPTIFLFLKLLLFILRDEGDLCKRNYPASKIFSKFRRSGNIGWYHFDTSFIFLVPFPF